MSRNINVLLIEDNPADARLVREALKETADPGYRVEWVRRLSLGLNRLAEGGIDVLLLDLGLPDSQGLETLAAGKLAPSVNALASADELVVRDLLAFAVQSGPKAKEWATTIKNDGNVVLAAENVLRRQLGLSLITTTTTPKKHSFSG